VAYNLGGGEQTSVDSYRKGKKDINPERYFSIFRGGDDNLCLYIIKWGYLGRWRIKREAKVTKKSIAIHPSPEPSVDPTHLLLFFACPQ
jgi:hypothetical protein